VLVEQAAQPDLMVVRGMRIAVYVRERTVLAVVRDPVKDGSLCTAMDIEPRGGSGTPCE